MEKLRTNCRKCWANGELFGQATCWLDIPRKPVARQTGLHEITLELCPEQPCPKPYTRTEFFALYQAKYPQIDIVEAFKIAYNNRTKREAK